MAMAKRLLLFVLTNVLILLTILFFARILGVDRFLTQSGMNWRFLLVFAAIIGFGGAFLSLAISRIMARWALGVTVIDPQTHDPAERRLVERVYELCRRANLPVMPQVGVYESDEVNAFATGPTRSRSLVAVSTGLLNRLDERAVTGVLAHEVAHIQNGDMVTMTLLQGVVNTFVVFLSRVIAYLVAMAARGDEEGSSFPMITYFIVSIVMEIFLAVLGSLVVMAYSRHREFGADAGGAQNAGKDNMIHALESLRETTELVDTSAKAVNTLKIAGGQGWLRLFASHPPLEERIERLRSASGRAPVAGHR
jgi:heat shock protein HtpX